MSPSILSNCAGCEQGKNNDSWNTPPSISVAPDTIPASDEDMDSNLASTIPLPSLESTAQRVSCDTSDRDKSPYASPIASTSFSVPPRQIRPLPKMTGERKKTNKARVSTAILTSTPYKNFLEGEMSKKSEKEAKKKKRNDTKLNFKTTKEKVYLKGKGKEKEKVAEKSKGPKPKRSKCAISESSSEDEVEDAECLFCNELFSNNNRGEGWIKCCICLRWGHDACAGVDPDDADEFTCDFCADNCFASVRKQLRL